MASSLPDYQGVRLIRRTGEKLVLAIDLVEGSAINELVVRWPDAINLRETKRPYHALFRNRFEAVAGGTRFTIDAEIYLQRHVRLLQPFLYGYARRLIERFQLHRSQGRGGSADRGDVTTAGAGSSSY